MTALSLIAARVVSQAEARAQERSERAPQPQQSERKETRK